MLSTRLPVRWALARGNAFSGCFAIIVFLHAEIVSGFRCSRCASEVMIDMPRPVIHLMELVSFGLR